jgi:hypothetical protein
MVDAAPDPVAPAYEGPCVAGLVPALLGPGERESRDWLPAPALHPHQLVLLVVDGLGWYQLQERAKLAPGLASMTGGPITSVAPTTTAAALTSITTGLSPAEHGMIGYRVQIGEGEVLNLLRWRTAAGDASGTVPPGAFQPQPAFGGTPVPVVTRSEFAATGFTAAHLSGSRLRGWRVASSIGVEVERALRAGEPFVYAYYDGLDKVAHEQGLGAHFEAELRFVDQLVEEVCNRLPPGAALLVTSDHGQVMVGNATITLPPELLADLVLQSGEGRFRWLHARPGAVRRVADTASALYGELAWVMTREELIEQGWFGGPLRPDVERRLGDVALIARAPVAFNDPADPGELTLASRHGSLTREEMWVPLLAWGP